MRSPARFTKRYRRLALAVLTIAALGVVFFPLAARATGSDLTTQAQRTVISDQEIQAAIDGKIDQATADRQAIQLMLQRQDVRRVAGAAGLDLKRASAAAAVLSGSSLERLAAQARTVNESGIVGGDEKIVITTTGLIIILLILILLLN